VDRENFGVVTNVMQDDNPSFMDKLHFHYLSQTYRVFLAGEDNFEVLEKEMEDLFEHRNETAIKDIQRLQEENELLVNELNQLTQVEVSCCLIAIIMQKP
jgi:SMC interacting uncharacterized protein involved in chromosome segregation